MLVTIDRAAQIFSVPPGYLLRRMYQKLKRATTGEIIVEFLDVARELRCPDEVTAKVLMGTEWLMGSMEIERLYGYGERERRRIASAPAFIPYPHDPVWRVSPFLAHLQKHVNRQRRIEQGATQWRQQK